MSELGEWIGVKEGRTQLEEAGMCLKQKRVIYYNASSVAMDVIQNLGVVDMEVVVYLKK